MVRRPTWSTRFTFSEEEGRLVVQADVPGLLWPTLASSLLALLVAWAVFTRRGVPVGQFLLVWSLGVAWFTAIVFGLWLSIYLPSRRPFVLRPPHGLLVARGQGVMPLSDIAGVRVLGKAATALRPSGFRWSWQAAAGASAPSFPSGTRRYFPAGSPTSSAWRSSGRGTGKWDEPSPNAASRGWSRQEFGRQEGAAREHMSRHGTNWTSEGEIAIHATGALAIGAILGFATLPRAIFAMRALAILGLLVMLRRRLVQSVVLILGRPGESGRSGKRSSSLSRTESRKLIILVGTLDQLRCRRDEQWRLSSASRTQQTGPSGRE